MLRIQAADLMTDVCMALLSLAHGRNLIFAKRRLADLGLHQKNCTQPWRTF